jgi:hypothetical protein
MSGWGKGAALAVLGAGAVVGSLVQAAWGETFTVAPGGVALAQVGTQGSNADDGAFVAVSHGGCTHGWVAVGIGNPSGCPQYWVYPLTDHDGELAAVALFGGSAQGPVAVSDTGPANGRCLWPLSTTGCLTGAPGNGIGASVAGPASGMVAASGLGNAGATPSTQPGVAVSGTGTATSNGVSVAGGDADAHGGYVAVSATGDADGGSVANLDLVSGLTPTADAD